MKKLIIVAICSIGLAGCVTDQSSVAPPVVQVVKVPVYKPIPTPPVINKPNLAVNSLTDTSTQTDRIKALELTNVQLIAYANKLKTALNAYKQIK